MNDLSHATLESLLTPKHATLLLQPIYPLGGGAPYAHEAFLRLTHHNGTVIEPSVFLPAATNAGLLDKLDLLTLNRLRAQILPIANRFTGLLSLNIASASLESRGYLHTLASPTWKHVLPHLLLEVPLRNIGKQLAIMDYLAKAGIRFSVDVAPHDDLKSILGVKTITSCKFRVTQFSPAQLNDIVPLMKKHGHKVTISQIEDALQHRVATTAQVDYVQGFYYAKPQGKPSNAIMQSSAIKSA